MSTSNFPTTPLRPHYDVVIVGGATSGSSIAWNLSTNPDFKGSVLVVERDPSLQYSATKASNNCMRQQFATTINVQIAQYAADFVKRWGPSFHQMNACRIPRFATLDTFTCLIHRNSQRY
ncbi:FAD-dependent oxidoreductase [Aspergillus chevalieri]|uniref:FAD dependent oxidoreductase domain-containing protein n=1 Tax=Aspergillus chevalieri TaxID=182096 RepID=A0A7R7ZK13_ASPCH|nr:uncharacterized protein ACHE_11029S [Aspergillus chevalieri]BCR83627.1 hypothetical protein ACHE_11029S [Aspergillus chevalieri]